nr:sigma-70 family RNA polymerase sigma factor [Bacteroidota bacterium]
MTDAELVKQCIKGNAEAHETLYKRFAGKMMTVCLRYASSQEEGEDFLQEGFIKVFEKLGSFKFEGALEGWIRRVIVNNLLDMVRKNMRIPHHDSIDDIANHPPAQMSTSDNIQTQDLLNMIMKLPKGYRTVFNLYVMEGFSHKEIAAELGINENTSKSQLSRARDQLQTMVNNASKLASVK